VRTLFQFLALWAILVLFAWSILTLCAWGIERLRATRRKGGDDAAELRDLHLPTKRE